MTKTNKNKKGFTRRELMRAFDYYAAVLSIVEDDWTEFSEDRHVILKTRDCASAIAYIVGVVTEMNCVCIKQQRRKERMMEVPISVLNCSVLEQVIRSMKAEYEKTIAEDTDIFENPEDFLPNYKPCI